jgi:hypothetical protein
MLFEAPIERPYYCKIGFTDNPLRRLDELQAGNPRPLRSIGQSRRPTRPFGLPLPDRVHASTLERRVHLRLSSMGTRLLRDLNYETNEANEREWFAEIHPEVLWDLISNMYLTYLHENALEHLLPQPAGESDLLQVPRQTPQ